MRVLILWLLLIQPAFGFFEVNAGQARYDIDLPGREHGDDDESQRSWAVYVGKDMGPFEVQLGYVKTGEFDIVSDDTGERTAVEVGAYVLEAVVPMGPFFVKGGVDRFDAGKTGTDVTWGFGFRWKVFTVGYDHIGVAPTHGNPDVRRFYLGVRLD